MLTMKLIFQCILVRNTQVYYPLDVLMPSAKEGWQLKSHLQPKILKTIGCPKCLVQNNVGIKISPPT